MKKLFLLLITAILLYSNEAIHTTPYLNVSGEYSTFLKVYNRNSCAIDIKANVHGDDGSSTTNSITLLTNLEQYQSKLIWASDLKTKAGAEGTTLANSFGVSLIMNCSDGTTIDENEIYTTVVQKSPEGQRIMPVYRGAHKITGSGSFVVSYVNANVNYATFIKVLNKSNSNITATLGTYPDATGTEYKKEYIFEANKVTLLWASDLVTLLKMPTDTSSFSLMISSDSLGSLYPTVVQKTSDGPRVLNVKLSSKTVSVNSSPATVESKATSITVNTKGRNEATFDTSHTFVSIPATTFTMGDSRYGVLYAAPEHQVSISKEYWISKNLITNEQFNTFVKETNYVSDLQKDSSEGCFVYDKAELGFLAKPGRYYANAFSNTSSLLNHPVVCISYNDAVAYAKWLSTKLSLNVAIATEAQWELAAKGTTQKKFPWGDSEPDGKKANLADLQFSIDYAGSSQGKPNTAIDDGYGGTSPVGNYPEGASEFGVMDMAGNASEWVYDYFSDYTSASLTDPTGPSSGTSRVNRGGNWVDDTSATTDQHTILIASRASDAPTSADDHMGFRVVINP